MSNLVRLTIMLDDRLMKKLRGRQAKEIKKSNKSVSLSKIMNQTLAKQLGVKLNGH